MEDGHNCQQYHADHHKFEYVKTVGDQFRGPKWAWCDDLSVINSCLCHASPPKKYSLTSIGLRHYLFSTDRSFALRDRGFWLISVSLAMTGLLFSTRTRGSLWQTQTGRLRGQVQPVAYSRKICFTIRSSSE